MKKLIFFVCVLSVTLSARSQSDENNQLRNKNSIQLELGGHGLFYSLSYERILFNGNHFKTAAQAGASYYPAVIGAIDFWMPVSINELYSLGNHHIELGAGVVPVYSSIRDSENSAVGWEWSAFLSFRLGYRYQKPDSRFLFRAGFTPVIETSLFNKYVVPQRTFLELHPLGGISFGYAF